MECPNQSSCCWGHVCPNGSKVRKCDERVLWQIYLITGSLFFCRAVLSLQCFHYTKGKCWFKGGKAKRWFQLLTYVVFTVALQPTCTQKKVKSVNACRNPPGTDVAARYPPIHMHFKNLWCVGLCPFSCVLGVIRPQPISLFISVRVEV